MSRVLHLASVAYFGSLPAAEAYRSDDFDRAGFIHCTKEPAMLQRVANEFYREAPGEMLVLVIDEARVEVRPAVRAPDGTCLSI